MVFIFSVIHIKKSIDDFLTENKLNVDKNLFLNHVVEKLLSEYQLPLNIVFNPYISNGVNELINDYVIEKFHYISLTYSKLYDGLINVLDNYGSISIDRYDIKDGLLILHTRTEDE